MIPLLITNKDSATSWFPAPSSGIFSWRGFVQENPDRISGDETTLMTKRMFILIGVAIVVLLSTTIAFADTLSKKKRNQFMGVIGSVRAAQQTTAAMVDVCVLSYPALAKEGDRVIAGWDKRNSVYVFKAKQMEQRVIASLIREGGEPQAVLFKNELRQFTNDQRSNSLKKIRTMKPKEKRYVCKQLLVSIDAGKWDIETVSPEVHHYLLNLDRRKTRK